MTRVLGVHAPVEREPQPAMARLRDPAAPGTLGPRQQAAFALFLAGHRGETRRTVMAWLLPPAKRETA